MDMKSEVRRLTEQIGSEKLQAALGVSEYSIRHARTTGRFPASWFTVVRDLCGGECSEELFNFKIPGAPHSEGSE